MIRRRYLAGIFVKEQVQDLLPYLRKGERRLLQS